MIQQLNFNGRDKVEMALSRMMAFEPEDGYFLAFSGGKDSVVIKALADMAGVKYDAHYNITTVDPPELVRFIREKYPDVIFDRPEHTMWQLIPKKGMPPTRLARYCCDYLKEGGGKGRFVMTGVRWAESARRKNNRTGLELNAYVKRGKKVLDDPDNPANEQLARVCPTKGKHILNPIIDWDDDEVWEFIRAYRIPYCKLYDEGYERLGCIGCPMNTKAAEELEKYPKFKAAYLRAFDRMLHRRAEKGLKQTWESADEVMKWWLSKR